jgi:hypothetical protein
LLVGSSGNGLVCIQSLPDHLGLECAARAEGFIVAQFQETADETSRRLRNGKITATIAISWWIASIGGIIYVINNPPI